MSISKMIFKANDIAALTFDIQTVHKESQQSILI
jgi:hypothetical protein